MKMKFCDLTTGSDAVDVAIAGTVCACSVGGLALMWLSDWNRAPPVDPMKDEAYRRILIPREKASAVTGRGGVVKEAIEKQYGVRIRDAKKREEGPTSNVSKNREVNKDATSAQASLDIEKPVLKGIEGRRPDVVDAAIKMRYMLANYRVVTLELKIPSSLVGKVIGSSGSNIKHVQDDFSVRVKTETEEGKDTARVCITGPQENADRALRHLKDGVDEMKREDSRKVLLRARFRERRGDEVNRDEGEDEQETEGGRVDDVSDEGRRVDDENDGVLATSAM